MLFNVTTVLQESEMLTITAVHTTVGTIFVAVSIILVDRFGRRTLFCKLPLITVSFETTNRLDIAET